MSYNLCKNITIKNDILEVNVASNNVCPRTYYKTEYKVGNSNLEQNLFWLFTDMLSGELQLNSSVYNYKYAYYKALEYLKENYEEDRYSKKYNYFHNKIKELIGVDLTSDYWKNEELKNRYNNFEKENKDLINQLKYESVYKVYGSAFNIFKSALEEKEDNTLYTLYSEDYRSFIKCGRNGSFYYGYSSAKEKGKYKEIYCKMKDIDRANVVMKRVVLTDKEIQKELENQELEKQAKEKIKDLEQVKKDIEDFKNGGLNINRYYLKELCKLYDIKINIPKNLNYITSNGYNFRGNNSYKTSNTIRKIRESLIEKVGV